MAPIASNLGSPVCYGDRSVSTLPVTAIRSLAVVSISFAAGCVGSQIPLTDADDGFVDPAIVGTWREYPEDGEGDGESIRVVIDGGIMTIVTDLDWVTTCATADVYTAHSSLVAGRRYLNLRFVRCVGDVAENEQPSDACPYLIVRYAPEPDFPTLRDELGAQFLSELAAIQEAAVEPLALFSIGDPDYVEAAIEDRVIEGCAKCARRSQPCLTPHARALRRFVTKHAEEIFPEESWGLLHRVESTAAPP